MKVENFRGIKNQFLIFDDNGNKYLQSYDVIICKIDQYERVYLDEKYWDYSVITSKYRNLFLGESSKDTDAKIENGEYKLINLN